MLFFSRSATTSIMSLLGKSHIFHLVAFVNKLISGLIFSCNSSHGELAAITAHLN